MNINLKYMYPFFFCPPNCFPRWQIKKQHLVRCVNFWKSFQLGAYLILPDICFAFYLQMSRVFFLCLKYSTYNFFDTALLFFLLFSSYYLRPVSYFFSVTSESYPNVFREGIICVTEYEL